MMKQEVSERETIGIQVSGALQEEDGSATCEKAARIRLLKGKEKKSLFVVMRNKGGGEKVNPHGRGKGSSLTPRARWKSGYDHCTKKSRPKKVRRGKPPILNYEGGVRLKQTEGGGIAFLE